MESFLSTKFKVGKVVGSVRTTVSFIYRFLPQRTSERILETRQLYPDFISFLLTFYVEISIDSQEVVKLVEKCPVYHLSSFSPELTSYAAKEQCENQLHLRTVYHIHVCVTSTTVKTQSFFLTTKIFLLLFHISIPWPPLLCSLSLSFCHFEIV